MYNTMLRMFHEGIYVSIFMNYFNNDFSPHYKEVLPMTPALFHTRVIDGFTENQPHSSGSTLFGDAYLMGGLGLMIAVAIAYGFLSTLIDSQKLLIFTKTPFAVAGVITLFLLSITGGVCLWAMEQPLVFLFTVAVLVAMHYFHRSVSIQGLRPTVEMHSRANH